MKTNLRGKYHLVFVQWKDLSPGPSVGKVLVLSVQILDKIKIKQPHLGTSELDSIIQLKEGKKKKKAGPERRKVLQVATMKESSYTSLIPQKKVLRTLYALTTYTKEKTAHAFYIRHQHLVPTAHFKMSCSLSMKPRKIILLANITKDSMLDWKDSYALRWEQRFNLPLSQNQFFFLYQDIDTLHKNIQSSSEKKHKVKTKLSLLP